MNHIISYVATIDRRYRALVAIRSGYCQTRQPGSSLDDLTKLEVWIRENVEALFDTQGSVTDQDAETLLAIHQVYGDDMLFRQ